MSQPEQSHAPQHVDRLTSAAAALGYEIVDIAGFLDLVEEHARAQSSGLDILKARASDVSSANSDVQHAVETMAEHTSATVTDVEASVALVRNTSEKTRTVASWVQNVSNRTGDVTDTISAVRTNNQQIAGIATQVNTLAINAKIEAARAGESGRGFAVVAEAINDLSRKTADAAVQISNNIENLTNWISTLGSEATSISKHATDVLSDAGGTDTALGRVEASIASADQQAKRIAEQANRVQTAMSDFEPALVSIAGAIKGTSTGIEKTHERVLSLIDTSETIVQSTALIGDTSEDAPFIRAAQKLAAHVSAEMEAAIEQGRTSMSRLFDRNYRPIPGSNPEQFLTESTALLDQIMPPIQEPALEIDPRIVFVAAVDTNGYLPSHNKKFSQTPTNDPVWNTANCRNRRIFDDRVGLKSGRNTEPFLLQVYRRDMGGGNFKMMKDLSAPITVQGQHWGGLRLAYSLD
ncbi:MAG: methyl-accepting chemotaxis protein [Roseobacter sp.]